MRAASRLGTNTTFTLSGASQATAAFGAQTYQVRVAAGAQPAFIKIDDGTPTAAATVRSADAGQYHRLFHGDAGPEGRLPAGGHRRHALRDGNDVMPAMGPAWGRNLDVRVQLWRVVPAQAGTHIPEANAFGTMDPRLRGDDTVI